LAQIPTEGIDFCFSNAVLEHVDKSDFSRMVKELFRVLKPGGASSHRVDLKDYLGGGLNHLRFSENRWEGKLFKSSGFYTMRTDSRDRFGTPLEQRFTRPQIETMMLQAGLVEIQFSKTGPYWCGVGFKRS